MNGALKNLIREVQVFARELEILEMLHQEEVVSYKKRRAELLDLLKRALKNLHRYRP